MKRTRPLSYQISPDVVVRQDAGASRFWRVFVRSVEIAFTNDQQLAFNAAHAAAAVGVPDGALDGVPERA